MRLLRIGLAILVLPVVAIGGFVVWSQQPTIAGIAPPVRSAFDSALIARGARLAAIGNCDICHTAAGGAAYAGGRPIPTPFGAIYSSNITPAPGNGVGRWSEAAFRRAMREGVSRRGQHLYPAFPYDHYAKLNDDDLHALYAFIMTRTPVETFTPANALPFPLNRRWLLPLWNLLFFDRTPVRADPAHSPEWNRGAYLVEGLGHCGSCHTPRNLFGAENTAQALAGGEAEGWRAPALDGASPAPSVWDAAQLFSYLRHGWDTVHGAASGPMQPIVGALAQADEADLHAISTYLASLQSGHTPAAKAKSSEPSAGEELGGALFAGACAACHTGGPAMLPPHGIDLAFSTAVSELDPRDLILIVLDGIQPSSGRAGPVMPRFDRAFSEAQLTVLLGYIRAHYGNGPAWTDLSARLHEILQGRKQ